MILFRSLFGKLFHRRNESDARTAGRALGGGHFDGAGGCAPATILFRAVEAGAALAGNADFSSHGFVTWDLFLDELHHAAFAAGMDFFGHDIVFAGFDLIGFRAVTGGLAFQSEHGAARAKAERKGDESQEGEGFFHKMDKVEFRSEQAAAGCDSKRGQSQKDECVNASEHRDIL